MSRYNDTARGLAIGYIVAIVICVLFFLVVVPILGCCLYKRRQKRLRARNQASQSAYASRLGGAGVAGQQTQAGYHPVPNYGYPQQGQQGQQFYPQGQQQAGVAWPQQAQQGQQQPAQYGYYGGEQKPPGY